MDSDEPCAWPGCTDPASRWVMFGLVKTKAFEEGVDPLGGNTEAWERPYCEQHIESLKP